MLELTETSVAEDPTRAEDQLTVLRRAGVRIAIDDFGTGWSSLAQLFSLPIGTLKIDRSLLVAAEQVTGGEGGAVLAAIVALTRTLGIRSVAEGVETVDHLRMVREAGCDLVQGWLLGHPMPADEIVGLAARGCRTRAVTPAPWRPRRTPVRHRSVSVRRISRRATAPAGPPGAPPAVPTRTADDAGAARRGRLLPCWTVPLLRPGRRRRRQPLPAEGAGSRRRPTAARRWTC